MEIDPYCGLEIVSLSENSKGYEFTVEYNNLKLVFRVRFPIPRLRNFFPYEVKSGDSRAKLGFVVVSRVSRVVNEFFKNSVDFVFVYHMICILHLIRH